MAKIVSKSKFKPYALKYFRQVQETGEELIITDRSRPVLKIVPYSESPEDVLKSLRGSVLKYESPMQPVADDEWEAMK